MIGYLEGTLFKLEEERLLLLTQQVGYEILLPAFVRMSIGDLTEGDPLSLFIYYHQTERQPKPVLIGFRSETEKAFFQCLPLFFGLPAILLAGWPVSPLAR